MGGRLTVEFRERAKAFAARIIRLYVRLPERKEEVRICGKQLLRAGTSVAAHIREASRARSSAEFISKVGGAIQELDEAQLWLELLREECGIPPENTRALEIEASELIAIMTAMIKKSKSKMKNKK